jgi:hypothetical protein
MNELTNIASSEQKYEFFVDGVQVTGKLSTVLAKLQLSSESVVAIQFHPQSMFRIADVTRCTSSLPGHTDDIACAHLNPDCLQLTTATGNGGACVRQWGMNTETPCRASPTGRCLSSGPWMKMAQPLQQGQHLVPVERGVG